MIEIKEFVVKDGSRVYGEVAHLDKKAFEVNIDPANVIGAMTGGYVAKRHYDKQQLKNQELERRRDMIKPQGLAEQAEPQMRQMIQELKIVFTPINVVYLVNGTTVEIIRTNEMTQKMQAAFLRKDANYFRDLLLNKMNMEIQLVQQAMMQSMLASKGIPKQASQWNLKEVFDQFSEEQFLSYGQRMSEKLAGETIDIPVNLEGLRPFSNHDFFGDEGQMTKVAALFDMQVFNASDLEHKLNVGFLPDRVTFLVDGQMVEQLPLLSMNEEGVTAFKIRDKAFFKRFYLDTARAQEAQFAAQTFDKQAANLNEVVESIAEETLRLRPLTPTYSYFEDADIHPLLYVKIFDKRYPSWREQSLEALVSQIEDDFDTEVSQVAFDKIAMIKTLSNPDHSLFMSDFTYEKMVRAFAGKVVDFTIPQGNVDLGEILFSNDLASVLTDGENFIAFDDAIIEYTVNQVTDEGVRFILPMVFEDEDDHESEATYYKLVNGMLARVWKEGEDDGTHDLIVRDSTTILEEYAEHIDPYDVEESLSRLVPGSGEWFTRSCADQVAAMFEAAEYLEVRQRLYQEQRDRFVEDWGMDI